MRHMRFSMNRNSQNRASMNLLDWFIFAALVMLTVGLPLVLSWIEMRPVRAIFAKIRRSRRGEVR